jgi:cobalt-zinc-cadmium efflux system protein
VRGLGVILFGLAGIAVNGGRRRRMWRAARGRDDLNLRGALWHTSPTWPAPSASSWRACWWPRSAGTRPTPVIALGVSVLCVASARELVVRARPDPARSAPRRISTRRRSAARCAPSRASGEVHDLHIWTITSGFDAVSVHVIAAPGVDQHACCTALEEVLQSQFGVTHTTIQVDRDHTSPLPIHRMGCSGGTEARTTAPTLHEHNH